MTMIVTALILNLPVVKLKLEIRNMIRGSVFAMKMMF